MLNLVKVNVMKSIVPFFTLFFFSSLAVAKMDSVELEQPYRQFQQQNKHQIIQLQQAQQQNWISQHQYQTQNQLDSPAKLASQCLPYMEVKFVGVHLVDPTLITPVKNSCLSEKRLNQLSRDITALYLQQGYIYHPFQFEADGNTLIVKINEGKVSKISTESKQVNLEMILPSILGKPLNIWDLDQGLDQANKMKGSNVTVDVLPQENGDVELVFTNQQDSVISGFIGIDNGGSQYYKRWQAKLGVSIDNPFGLSDILLVGFSQSTTGERKNFSRSANLYYSLPYGYWSFSHFLIFSQFNSQIPLQYQQVEQKGNSWLANIRADYTFHRGSNHISSIYTALEYSRNRSYFAGSLLNLQSPTLTTWQFGINHLQLFENGSFIADLNYERGLKWGNVLINQGRDQPEGQFNKWNIELQGQYFHHWGSQLFHQSHRLAGQYSVNYLPLTEQTDLLGRYAVRGFSHITRSGEKNVVLQNTLGWMHYFNQWQFEPYVGVDVGLQKATGDIHHQKAIGYVLGAELRYKKLVFQLEGARGKLWDSNKIQTDRQVSLNVSLLW